MEGMPFGTRGGMVVRHTFPADGEYKFSVQNFGVGSFIPGEQLALIIDGEASHISATYRGVGLVQRHGRGRGRDIDVPRLPVRAGSRWSARRSSRRTIGPAST